MADQPLPSPATCDARRLLGCTRITASDDSAKHNLIEPPCTDPYARWCDRESPRGPTYVNWLLTRNPAGVSFVPAKALPLRQHPTRKTERDSCAVVCEQRRRLARIVVASSLSDCASHCTCFTTGYHPSPIRGKAAECSERMSRSTCWTNRRRRNGGCGRSRLLAPCGILLR